MKPQPHCFELVRMIRQNSFEVVTTYEQIERTDFARSALQRGFHWILSQKCAYKNLSKSGLVILEGFGLGSFYPTIRLWRGPAFDEWVSSRSSPGPDLISYKPRGRFRLVAVWFLSLGWWGAGRWVDLLLQHFITFASFLGCYLCGTSVTSHQSDANAAEGVSSGIVSPNCAVLSC